MGIFLRPSFCAVVLLAGACVPSGDDDAAIVESDTTSGSPDGLAAPPSTTPEISFCVPASWEALSLAQYIAVTATDDRGVDHVRLFFDNVELTSVRGAGRLVHVAADLDPALLTWGIHEVRAEVTDTDGHVVVGVNAIEMRPPPRLSVELCHVGSGECELLTPSDDGGLTWSVRGDVGGCPFGLPPEEPCSQADEVVQLRINAAREGFDAESITVGFGTQQVAAPPPFTWEVDLGDLGDGEHTLHIYAGFPDPIAPLGYDWIIDVRRCDSDGDGHDAESCGGDDCDDGSNATYPGSPMADFQDFLSDDFDCDGLPDGKVGGDEDGDGSAAGTIPNYSDCDDFDPTRHPGAFDVPGDGIDSNCDGLDIGYCDDGNPCTDDDVIESVCVGTPVPDGKTCQLYLGPTVVSACVAGVCVAGAGCAPPGVGFENECCQPQCDGRECGSDTCGGSCGTCAEGACTFTGQCEPPPQLEWIAIPKGDAALGCEDDAGEWACNDAPPPYEVTVEAFSITRNEITVEQYGRCVDGGECPSPSSEWGQCPGPGTGFDRHPVACVTMSEARDFCRYVGGRLCTVDEWGRAARGSDGRVFPWGNEPASCAKANAKDNPPANCDGIWSDEYVEAIDPVGGRPEGVSPFGVEDLGGNVSEWVEAWYEPRPPHGPTSLCPPMQPGWEDEAYSSIIADPITEGPRALAMGPSIYSYGSLRHVWGLYSAPINTGTEYIGIRCCGDPAD
ncbi:MAG: SUMF1/EgtB/PvdO family nonheme iron enzyme [Myxococcales bacterium]|nr:SUMF1/EgtB/PvdO family nonheme iron enzyme [Myxococcales bacterium]